MSEPNGSIENHTKRIANIERLRIVAALCITSYHTHSAIPRSLGVTGFIVLAMIFCVFIANKPKADDFTGLIKKKTKRLLKPWLFWSVIYGCTKLAKVICCDVPFSETFSKTMFLTGTRTHLWFLPFAFIAAISIFLVNRITSRIHRPCNIVVAILIGVVLVFYFSIIKSRIQMPVPLGQWMLGLPAIPLGFAIGQIMLLKRAQNRGKFYLLVALSIVATCLLLTWLGYGSIFAIRYCIAVAAVGSALYWQGNLDSVCREWATLTYGIYLIHPLVGTFLSFFEVAQQHPWVLLFFVFSISSLATLVLKKTPIKQFV